jgi:outer membrane protein TolC
MEGLPARRRQGKRAPERHSVHFRLLQVRQHSERFAGLGLLWVLLAWPQTGVCQAPTAVPSTPPNIITQAQAQAPGPILIDLLGRKNVHRLSLREALSLCLENSLEISIARVNPQISGQNIVIAEAGFDPTFTASTSVSEDINPIRNFPIMPDISRDLRFDTKISQNLVTGGNVFLDYGFDRNYSPKYAVGPVAIVQGFNPAYISNLKFQMQQPLLRGAGIDIASHDIRVAQKNYKISHDQFLSQLLDTMLQIQTAYWNLVLTTANLKIARQALERSEILRRNNEVSVRAGAMAPIDLKEAESEVANDQRAVLEAENSVLKAEQDLKRLMNVEKLSIMADTGLIPTNFPTFQRKAIDEAYCIETALTRRPDFEGKKTELERQKIDIKFYRNGLYPQVDLIGSFRLNGLGTGFFHDNQLLFSGNFYNDFLGLQMTMPLGGNRAAKARYTQAQLTAAQLLRQVKLLELQIVTDVRKKISDVRTNAERVQAARVARELNEERVDAAIKMLQVGRKTTLDVLTTQRDLANAQGVEISTIIDYANSLATLSRFMGTLFDELGIQTEEPPILR